jgi:hypothetical protein
VLDRAAILIGMALLAGACSGGGGGTTTSAPSTPPAAPTAAPGVAFFYQDVNAGFNTVRVGFSSDMHTVTPYNAQVLQWQVINGSTRVYSDPVYSRLANGRWAIAASASPTDSRGSGNLLYHEAACPRVDDSAVRVITRSTAAGCVAQGTLVGAKPSEIFEVNGSNYMFMMIDGRIHLVRMSDATRAATDLTSICVRSSPAASFASLQWGEATVVIGDATAPGLRLSDTGIARRTNGTWTLWVKGIPASTSCTQASLCELCARGIYRTTSADLLNWSTPERLVDQASVPDASVAPDGTVWYYWQSFAAACAAQDLNLAGRAPIRGAPETASGALGATVSVVFTGEAFETNTALHYPTNGNPVFLGDTAAKTSFDACFNR